MDDDGNLWRTIETRRDVGKLDNETVTTFFLKGKECGDPKL